MSNPSAESEVTSIPATQPSLEVIIPFSTTRQAEIAYNSLRVDREPKRSQILKTLIVKDNQLILTLVGPDARSLRLSSNSFFDHLILVQKTIDKFSLDKYSLLLESTQPPKAKKPYLKT